MGLSKAPRISCRSRCAAEFDLSNGIWGCKIRPASRTLRVLFCHASYSSWSVKSESLSCCNSSNGTTTDSIRLPTCHQNTKTRPWKADYLNATTVIVVYPTLKPHCSMVTKTQNFQKVVNNYIQNYRRQSNKEMYLNHKYQKLNKISKNLSWSI